MKKYIMAAAFSAAALQLAAQNEYDALRFSETYIQGTSRSAAMGGAFGALGGDISCMSINPAGVGVYHDGEFSASLEFISNKSKVTPTTASGEESKYSMKIPSFGFVLAGGTGFTSGVTNLAFGLAFNRIGDYTLREAFDYKNPSNSLLDSWCDRANGLHPDQLDEFTTGLGFNSFLIDTVGGRYLSPHDRGWDGENSGYGQRQRYNVDQKGGVNCWDFTLAGSISDRLFFGASLGIRSLIYKTTNVYKEDDEQDGVAYEYFDYTEHNKSVGGGVNLKLGIIYKPIEYLRLGAAIHTPTLYSITEQYYSKVAACYDPGTFDNSQNSYDSYSEDYDGISDDNDYKYKLVTPFKSVLSAAFVYPGYGMISFDFERVNYSKTKLRNDDFDDYDYVDQNDAAKEKFQSTSNFRVGAEALAGPVSIRAGYALYGNPLKFVTGTKERQIISGGLGFRLTSSFYIDIAATYQIYQAGSYIYESQNPEHSFIMNHDNRYFHVMTTLGFRF